MKTCAWVILILCAQIYDSFDERNFRCKSGEYISNKWFCNEKFDCRDKSDEYDRGCLKLICGRGKFGCDDTCKNATVRCNTLQECDDGTDELNCGDEINTNNCTRQNEKFLCDDKLRCLDFNYTCNRECNCFDCSDEKAGCWRDEGSHLACFRTPFGPHCCSEFDSICQKCSINSCQQKCIQFLKKQKCLCDENYIGVAGTNNSKCVSNESETDLLVYSTKQEIGVMKLHTKKTVLKKQINVTSVTGAYGDVYYAISDSGKGSIFKILNGSDETRRIKILGSEVTSLAVDWITNNTYFTTNMSSIIVCSENGTVCKQLKNSNALSIGLAPRFGLMFWVEIRSDNNSIQCIMKSAMDGSDETKMICFSEVIGLMEVGVDELTEKIYYWSDRDKLLFISFDNMEIRDSIRHDDLPPAFTVFETKVYFINFLQQHILRVSHTNSDAHSNTSIQMRFDDLNNNFTHLYAYNPKLQRTNISNPCVKSCPTNSLCLLRPTSFSKILNYTCASGSPSTSHEQNSLKNQTVETTTPNFEKGQNSINSGNSLEQDRLGITITFVLVFLIVCITSLM